MTELYYSEKFFMQKPRKLSSMLNYLVQENMKEKRVQNERKAQICLRSAPKLKDRKQRFATQHKGNTSPKKSDKT